MDHHLRTILEIEKSDGLPPIKEAVRAVAQPLGYDRFVMFSALPSRDELVDKIYWMEGDWFGDGTIVDS